MSLTSPRAVFDGVSRHHAIGDTGRFALISSFGSSEYFVTLVDVVNNEDGTVTVTWERRRDGNGAIADVTVDVLVDGQRIGGETSNFTSNAFTQEATGAGEAGDPVVIQAEATAFGGGSLTVTGTVPAAEPEPEPAVEVVSCSLDPPEFTIGDDVPVTMALEVRNDTGETVAIDAVIRVDGTEVNQLSAATIDAQSSRTFNISIGSGLSWEFGAGTFEPTFEITNVA